MPPDPLANSAFGASDSISQKILFRFKAHLRLDSQLLYMKSIWIIQRYVVYFKVLLPQVELAVSEANVCASCGLVYKFIINSVLTLAFTQ